MTHHVCALGHDIPAHDAYCSICGGVALQAACGLGHAMAADARYCGKCGGGIQRTDSAVPGVTAGSYSSFEVWAKGIQQDLAHVGRARLVAGFAVAVALPTLGTVLLAHGETVPGDLCWLAFLVLVFRTVRRAGPCPGCGDRVHRQETGREPLHWERIEHIRTVTEQRTHQHSGHTPGETVNVTRQERYPAIRTTYLVNYRCPSCGYQSTGNATEETPA